jgi:hypothetical protein
MRVVLATVVAGLCLATSGCALSHERGRDGAVDVGRPATGVLMRCASDMAGVGRDCGWDRGASFSCTPGAMIDVGCSAECGLGSCSGDAMLRLCNGETECTAASALAQSDDACGSLCPRAEIRCPSGGRFTVLTAPFGSERGYSCSVVVR